MLKQTRPASRVYYYYYLMHFAELRHSELLEQQKLVIIDQSMHYLQPLQTEKTIKLKYQILLYQSNNKSM